MKKTILILLLATLASGVFAQRTTRKTTKRTPQRTTQKKTSTQKEETNVQTLQTQTDESQDTTTKVQSPQTNTETSKTKSAGNQQNMVSLAINPIWSCGLKVKYERVYSDVYTYGAFATAYYGDYSGFKIAPFARYYFKRKAPEGLYAQLKLVLGFYSYDYTEYKELLSDAEGPESIDKTDKFFNGGLGAALGYQTCFGKQDQWSVDLNLGLKITGGAPGVEPDENYNASLTGISWYLWNAGSVVDGLISVGYRF